VPDREDAVCLHMHAREILGHAKSFLLFVAVHAVCASFLLFIMFRLEFCVFAVFAGQASRTNMFLRTPLN